MVVRRVMMTCLVGAALLAGTIGAATASASNTDAVYDALGVIDNQLNALDGEATVWLAETKCGAPTATRSAAQTQAVCTSNKSACPSSYACMWRDTGFFGGPGQVSGNNKHWTELSTKYGCDHNWWNDCASSLYNHGTQCDVYYFVDSDYQPNSSPYYVAKTDSKPSLSGWNDVISSNRWCHP